MQVIISASANHGSTNHSGGLSNPNPSPHGLSNPHRVVELPALPSCALHNSHAAEDVRVPASLELKDRKPVIYRECLKNHAAHIGVHATDGCCEFIPTGPEGTLEALTCAACHCHRNFHRRETEGELATCRECGLHGSFMDPRSRDVPTCTFPAPLPLSSSTLQHSACLVRAVNNSDAEAFGGRGAPPPASLKKRIRTKFTEEQKERMASFAEALGWRIQKQEDGVVEQFCREIGVKRQVFKVWMHNNKLTVGKKVPCLTMTPENAV